MPGWDPRMNMLGNGIAYSAPPLSLSLSQDGIEADFFLQNQRFDYNVSFLY